MERHILISVLGFALGILVQSIYELSWIHVVYVLFITFIIFVLYHWKHTPLYLAVIFLLAGSVVGMVRTELVPQSIQPQFASLLLEGGGSIEGKVVADPDVRETTKRLTVLVEKEGVATKVLVVAPLYPSVRYGEVVQAEGMVEAPEPFASDGGRTFAYDRFLAKDGVFAVMQNAQVEVVHERSGFFTSIRGALSDMKFAGIAALAVALPEPHASLAAGLILGGKQGLGETLLNDFIRSGLVHIVVLSGYNVMIVADFITRTFGFLSKANASALGGFTIAAFVLAAGAGPASIRALLLAGIALYGRATGRTYQAFRALLLAGVCMLLWNPLTLPYDPGFQLSFVATLGLIFGAPITERWFTFIPSSFLREIVASTIAAQIAVLPLLLYQNGLFSLVALPANLLVLPLVPAAMLASFLGLLAGVVVPFAAPVAGLPAYTLLSYIIGVVEIASNLPLAAVTIPAFPFVLTLLAYTLLIWYVRKAMRLPAFASLRRSS